MFYILSII